MIAIDSLLGGKNYTRAQNFLSNYRVGFELSKVHRHQEKKIVAKMQMQRAEGRGADAEGRRMDQKASDVV